MALSATTQRLIFYGGLTALLSGAYLYATVMPGRSHSGGLPLASPAMRAAALDLKVHVAGLATAIGERRVGEGESLTRARDYVASELDTVARAVNAKVILERLGSEGSDAANVILDLPGESSDTLVIGAHYDSAVGTPGANDNASGVAVGLYLAKQLSGKRLLNSLRFVFFANEEPPYFQNPGMGSLTHARGCAERGERILAMLALESLGYYSDEPESQRYPWPVGLLYPDRGNFVGFVGSLGSRSLVRESIRMFRASARFPSEGAALPAWIPGVGWSDHWAFWQYDYPALMITDTALYRDPNYHQGSDVPSNLSYEPMARVALGLLDVIRGLAGMSDAAHQE
jgi:peptidase M28-like protein